jgi:hypothetical protein
MGLGKTLQTLSLIAYLHETHGVKGPHLLICPLSVLGAWMTVSGIFLSRAAGLTVDELSFLTVYRRSTAGFPTTRLSASTDLRTSALVSRARSPAFTPISSSLPTRLTLPSLRGSNTVAGDSACSTRGNFGARSPASFGSADPVFHAQTQDQEPRVERCAGAARYRSSNAHHPQWNAAAEQPHGA